MVPVLFLYYVLLSGNTYQTWGHRSMQPYGPKLCEVLCQSTEGCSDTVFDELQLTCRLVINALASKRTSVFCVPRHQDEVKTSSRKLNDPLIPAFFDACRNGRLDEVKTLVCEGLVDINTKGFYNKLRCILTSMEEENRAMFDFLMQQGCDLSVVDQRKRGVLHYACLSDGIHAAKKLLDSDIDIESRDVSGKTPLMYAHSLRLVELLKYRGADFKAIDLDNNTYLHVHVARRTRNEDIVRFVLSFNVIDVECRGKFGRTILMVAVKVGDIPIVDLLHKDYNASLTSIDNLGFNVLHVACFSGRLNMVQYLLNQKDLRGVERGRDNNGRTPRRIARKKGFYDIVSLLKS